MEMVFKHQHFHEKLPETEVEFPARATLEGAVSDALASAGGVDASEVSVIAHGSEITLTGTVQLQKEIGRAGEVALNVAGVTGVRNDIRSQTMTP